MKKVGAHKLVMETAEKMASELYEEVMSGNNTMYGDWKAVGEKKGLSGDQLRRLFVMLVAPKLLEPARAILANILSDPRQQHLHETIYHSILQDNSICASRRAHEGRTRLHIAKDGSVKNLTGQKNG